MNQINKILSGLKKRRTGTPPEDAPAESARFAAIRAKLPQNKIVLFAALGFVALSAAGGLGLWLYRTPASPVETAQAPSRPVSTPKPAAAPEPPQVEVAKEEVVQAMAASQPVVGAPQEEAAGKVDVAKPENVVTDVPQESGSHEKVAEKAMPQEAASGVGASTASEPLPVQEKKEAAKSDKRGPETSVAAAKQAAPAAAERKKQKAVAPSPEAEMEDMASEAEPVGAAGGLDKQVKPLSAEEQANNEFIKASGLAQRGNIKEALAGYETVLHLDPGHEPARQAMVVLLLQGKRNAEAERVLQEGLEQNIKNSNFAMLLARIQLDRDAPWSALLTLQKTLPYAVQQADYQAFVAALLQRLNKHKEAAVHYQMAVELAPDSGVWWMGLGISLKALRQTEDARAAFKRALQSNTLSADLRDFVSRQLREL